MGRPRRGCPGGVTICGVIAIGGAARLLSIPRSDHGQFGSALPADDQCLPCYALADLSTQARVIRPEYRPIRDMATVSLQMTLRGILAADISGWAT